MLKGQAKKDYQCNYMRKRRLLDPSVRPNVQPKRCDCFFCRNDRDMPELDADGQPIPEFT